MFAAAPSVVLTGPGHTGAHRCGHSSGAHAAHAARGQAGACSTCVSCLLALAPASCVGCQLQMHQLTTRALAAEPAPLYVR